LKATVREPTKAKVRKDIPKTVDELLKTHPKIASLNERIRAAVNTQPAPAPQPRQSQFEASPLNYVMHSHVQVEEVDAEDIEALILNQNADIVAPIRDVDTLSQPRKRKSPPDHPKASESKRQKVDEASDANNVHPDLALLHFAKLLDTLPAELRKPLWRPHNRLAH